MQARSQSTFDQDLMDERAFQPRLKPSTSLAPAAEATAQERARASRVYQVLQARPEDLAGDRFELEKLDRAMISARKQVFAAKAENVTLKAELEQARDERTPNGLFYGVGGLAAACFLGWVWERRRLMAAHPDTDTSAMQLDTEFAAAEIPSELTAPPSRSEFDGSDLEVTGDEADQWIERARVAMPDPSQVR